MNFTLFFSWLGAVASVIAIFAGIIGTFRFFTVRLIQAKKEEFERYHQVVRQMNVDSKENTPPYLDMQVAATFELTLIKKYHPVSLRILQNRLKSLQKKNEYPFLCEEIIRSIQSIEKSHFKKSRFF